MTAVTHIDHIAIVVKSIDEVRSFYEQTLGLVIEHIEDMPARGIRVAFIPLGQVRIELIEPTEEQSEVTSFLQKRGPGLHHIALKTPNIKTCEDTIRGHGAKLLYEEARSGAHQSKVNFIHPSSTGGVLMEIVE